MTESEMWSAEIIHGLGAGRTDTYRLIHLKEDGTQEFLDIQGWMVGDPDLAKEKCVAADVIRARVLDEPQGSLWNG